MRLSAFPFVSCPAFLARSAGARAGSRGRRLSRVALVVVLHGGGGQGADGVSTLGNHPLSVVRTVADREGFAVAYPAGTDDEWNDCRSDAPAHEPLPPAGLRPTATSSAPSSASTPATAP